MDDYGDSRLADINVELIDFGPTVRISIEAGDLTESIRKRGLREPITVRPNGDRYEVIVGNRRLAAAKELGLKTISCIIEED